MINIIEEIINNPLSTKAFRKLIQYLELNNRLDEAQVFKKLIESKNELPNNN